MQKAIHVDGNGVIKRILSITDISAVETSPNGLTYIAVEYVEPPAITNSMDIAYPMYNSDTQTMFWQIVNYQNSISDVVLQQQNMQIDLNSLNAEDVELWQSITDSEINIMENEQATTDLEIRVLELEMGV